MFRLSKTFRDRVIGKTLVVHNFRHYWQFCVDHVLTEKAGVEISIC